MVASNVDDIVVPFVYGFAQNAAASEYSHRFGRLVLAGRS